MSLERLLLHLRYKDEYFERLDLICIKRIMKMLPRSKILGKKTVKTSFHRVSKEMRFKIEYLESKGIKVIKEKLPDRRYAFK